MVTRCPASSRQMPVVRPETPQPTTRISIAPLLSCSRLARFEVRFKPVQGQLPLEIAVVRAGCADDHMAGVGKADQFHRLLAGAERVEELLALLNGTAIVVLGLQQEQ